METCIFTLCSINYLAYAKILGDSLLKFNPNLRFIIGLVDVIECNIDLSEFSSFEIIEINKTNIPYFEEKTRNYDIVELNTAIKPSFFKYLFRTNKNLMKVIYLDPDIAVFDKLTPAFEALDKFDVVLTPHIIKPMKDKQIIDEELFLKYGLCNLGFIGVKRSDSAFDLLDWWERKMLHQCRRQPENGLWVDQKWMDLAPILFEHIGILKHPGLNVAWWNTHERHIIKKDDKLFVNNKYPLIFFHFGAMSLGSKNKRGLEESAALLFENHGKLLIVHKHSYWKQFECRYAKLHEAFKKNIQEKEVIINSNKLWLSPDLTLWGKIGVLFLAFLKLLIPRAIKKKIKKSVKRKKNQK
ncbi:MAG: glycosyltransferase [Omnitrophica bacterium]|nr:glycosyltransferase [Candidatus Omnitrophota bacterium]